MRNVPLSIIIVTIIGIPLGVTQLPTHLFNVPSGIGEVTFRIDILGVANQAGWLDENGDMPGIEKCFKVDSLHGGQQLLLPARHDNVS